MKTLFAVLALVPLGPLVSSHLSAPAAPAAAAPVQPAAADFRGDFQRAYKIADHAGMSKLVRDASVDAAAWLYELASSLTRQPDEERQRLFDALNRAWFDAFTTRFGDRVLAFWQGLDDAGRTRRGELYQEYFALTTTYFAKRGEPITPARNTELQAIGDRFDPIAQALFDLGDGYFASRAWMYVGDAYSPQAVGDAAAIATRELAAQKKALAACDAMDIGDRSHRECRTRVTTLEGAIARGTAKGVPDPKAEGAAKLPFEFAAPVTVAAKALELSDPKKFPRLAYGWDDAHPTWPTLYLKEVGQTAAFAGMIDGPTFERQGLLDVVVTDQDGNSSRVVLSRELQLVTTRVGRGERAVPYTFGAMVGNRDDEFQGFSANLESTASNLAIYLRPAAAVVVDVAGTPVHVLDDNLDGIFGGPPTDVTVSGVAGGTTQTAIDSVFVGKSKTPVPFSEVLQVGKAWYRLTSADNGRTFDVALATGLEVGTVQLAYKGADLEWVVVRGTKTTASLFHRLEPGKPVELPVGEYRVFSGVVRDGAAKSLLVPGDAEPFTVTAGARTDLVLGGPFRFDFSSSETPEGVKVKGTSVVVVGAGGEHYTRFWGSRPSPEVHLRKAGGGPWTKVGQLGLIDDIDELGEHGGDGWTKVWWPLDGTFENKLGDGVDVRLVEKKNPLFGKIDSAPE
jgi:hypothetical protein